MRGVGRGGREEICPKTLFFRGIRHDNKILKVQILLSRNFVVIAQAPSLAKKNDEKCDRSISHRVLQGGAQRGGGAILLHFFGSPAPFFIQQNKPFLP